MVTQKKRLKVFMRDDYKCKRCGVTENLSIDHIFPVSKGGSNKLINLETLCVPCNQKKSNKVEISFRSLVAYVKSLGLFEKEKVDRNLKEIVELNARMDDIERIINNLAKRMEQNNKS